MCNFGPEPIVGAHWEEVAVRLIGHRAEANEWVPEVGHAGHEPAGIHSEIELRIADDLSRMLAEDGNDQAEVTRDSGSLRGSDPPNRRSTER